MDTKTKFYVRYYERPSFIEIIPCIFLKKPISCHCHFIKMINFGSLRDAKKYIKLMTHPGIEIKIKN